MSSLPEDDLPDGAEGAADSLDGVEEGVERRRHHRPHAHRRACLVVRTQRLYCFALVVD